MPPYTKRMALLIHLSFKVSNNRFFFFFSFIAKDVSYRTIIQRGKRGCFFFCCFLAMSKCSPPAKVQPPRSLRVLHVSLRDGATAARSDASVGGISGTPACGRGLVPGSPSICRLSQSCTLLTSLPRFQSLSPLSQAAKYPSFI